jgi:hypothetical protein
MRLLLIHELLLVGCVLHEHPVLLLLLHEMLLLLLDGYCLLVSKHLLLILY